jgi:hypothetical protein
VVFPGIQFTLQVEHENLEQITIGTKTYAIDRDGSSIFVEDVLTESVLINSRYKLEVLKINQRQFQLLAPGQVPVYG